MNRTSFGAALALLLFAGSLLTPSTSSAINFIPLWALAGWNYVGNVGTTDGDAQDELLVSSKADGHYALVDARTGLVEVEFPEFKAGETGFQIVNIDSDPRLELIFTRVPGFSGPIVPLTKAYKWTPGGYITLFTHTDPTTQFGLVHLRSASQTEMFELSNTDLRVRDMAGTVLFKASTAISPWTGVDPYLWVGDLDGDGVDELGVIQHAQSNDVQTLFFHYNNGFVYTWSASSWFMTNPFKTDGDAHAEVLAWNRLDGRYAFFDGVSGTPDLELPEFTVNNNSSVFAVDVDGDGRQEIFASRPASVGVTPLVRAYKWVAGNYVQMFTHTQEPLGQTLVHSRTATQFEFVDVTPTDVVLRDAVAGTVLFRASTQLAGWSGSNVFVNEADQDHDGILELIIQDGATARVVRYIAGAYTQLWSSTAWQYPFAAPKLDGDHLDGVLAYSSGDAHFGLLDSFTGAVRQEFPAFSSPESGAIPVDMFHNGLNVLMMVKHPFSGPNLTTCYRWSASGFITQFSHTDETNGFVVAPLRDKRASDVLEVASTNGVNTGLRVRGFDGTVLWQTSNIPGWTGVGFSGQLDTLDVDHSGLVEFLAIDDAAIRLVAYGGLLGVEDGRVGPALQMSASVPNPFRNSTTLRFSTRSEGDVAIGIYDASGRLVRRLDQHLPAGDHAVKWDGRDTEGGVVPNGVLFYDVRTAGVRATRKLVHIGG